MSVTTTTPPTAQLASTSRVFNVGSNNAIKYRNGSMLSDIEIQFPNLFFKDKVIREIMLSITHAEIPNSFYLVNATNNVLVVNASTFVITPGNYNAITFQTAIQPFLTGLNITMSYSLITNKYTWTSGVAFTIQSTSTCQQFLGISTSGSLSGTNVSSPYVTNFLPISRILFRSNAFNLTNYNQADGSNNLLLSVQNSSASGALVLYNNYANLRYDITSLDSINVVDISVTDDVGNMIDFNNCNWYLTFRIEYIFELAPNNITSFSKAISAGSGLVLGGSTAEK